MVFIPSCSTLSDREELVKAADAILTRREEMLKKAEVALRDKEAGLDERERLLQQREAAVKQPGTAKGTGDAKPAGDKGSTPVLGYARKTVGGRARAGSKQPRVHSPAKSMAPPRSTGGGGRAQSSSPPPAPIELSPPLVERLRKRPQAASSLPGDIHDERIAKKTMKLKDIEAHLRPKKAKPAWQYWMSENKARVKEDAGGDGRQMFTCAFAAYERLADKSKWESLAGADMERYKREMEELGCRVEGRRAAKKKAAAELVISNGA